MIFSSLVFLCIFLPITYILYTILPSLKMKNGLLILVSLIFYAYGEPVYVLLMIFSAFMNYLCARWIGHIEHNRKLVLIMNLILNFGMLGVFKYTHFIIDTCNKVFHLALQSPEISLPVGISFFTFQAVSYVMDVYSKKVEPQKSFWSVLLYISFFPQLIAGPIVKYREIQIAIENRTQDAGQAALGMRRFICGLAKKVLISNAMGQVADTIFAADTQAINIVIAWIGAIAYLMQIYYDFSGYSDMAIGLGKMFGFQFSENFQYPYGATTIKEFWRRWHISLSSWFREYVYIPLGGNRKGKVRASFNRMLVFFLTGLWHGANWTFVLWGIYHGLLILFEEHIPVVKKLPKWISHIYLLLTVTIGFVMFRADTVTQGCYFIRQMFTGITFTPQAVSLAWQQMTPYFLVMLVAAFIGMAPIQPVADKIREQLYRENAIYSRKWKVLQVTLYVGAVALLAWCMIRLTGGTYNPFIYFRF